MSFPKAKYQRFNEYENGVPPPGTYDPNFDVAAKSFSIEKSARFHENKSTTDPEVLLPACGKSSENLVTTFLTPQSSRRRSVRTCSSSSSKIKKNILNTDDKEKVKTNLKTQLKDLQLECKNKNTTIKEYEEVIENLKEQLRIVEEQLQELSRTQTEMEGRHKTEIESMVEFERQLLCDHNEKRQTEVEILQQQMSEVSAKKESELERRKIMEEELRNQITELSGKVINLKSEMADSTKIHEDEVQSLQIQIEELTVISKKLNEEHQMKVNLLEEEKSQFSLQVNKLTEECAKLRDELEKRENMVLQLQEQLSVLQSELDKVKAEYEKSVEDSAKEIHTSVIKYREEIDKLKINFEKEKNILLNEKQLEISCRLEAENLSNDLTNRLGKVHYELEESQKKSDLALMKYKEDLNHMQKIYNEENSQLKELLDDTTAKHLQEKENLMIAKNKEIAELTQAFATKIEEEAERMKEYSDRITEESKAEAVAAALKDHSARVDEYMKNLIAKKVSNMNVMTQQVRNAVAEEMRLNIERCKAYLVQLETEQTAMEKKVALKDDEITELLNTLTGLVGNENLGEDLQIDRNRIETELVEKKNELMALKDEIRAEAEEMTDTRKRIDMIIAENQALLGDLSERIIENTTEAEELSVLEEHGDACVREHLDLLNTMRSSSLIAYEQVLVLMEQMDAKKRLIDQFEAKNSINRESMKSMYVTTIEDLLRTAEDVIIKLRKEHDDDNNERIKAKNMELNELYRCLKEAENTKFELTEKNNMLLLEISQAELFQRQLVERLNINVKLIEENTNLAEAESVDAMDQNETDLLENERSKQETLAEAIMAELEKEKTRREAAEGEVQKLTEHNERLMKDYQAMSEKYADLVGHQNHKQKIKHVSQLKDKISQLEQELQVTNKTIEKLQRMIVKLKEEKRSCCKGK